MYFRLDDNQLIGEMPREPGRLSNLRILHPSDNQLGGEIPADLGSLSQLQRFTRTQPATAQRRHLHLAAIAEEEVTVIKHGQQA